MGDGNERGGTISAKMALDSEINNTSLWHFDGTEIRQHLALTTGRDSVGIGNIRGGTILAKMALDLGKQIQEKEEALRWHSY